MTPASIGAVPATRWLTGTGFPTMAAPVGTRYTDTAATNGAVEWIKASGSGSSGWEVTHGDTGWRNVATDLGANFTTSVVSAGAVRMRRVNDRVTITIRAGQDGSLTGLPITSRRTFLTIPTGFRVATYHWYGYGFLTSSGLVGYDQGSSVGRLDLVSGTGNWGASSGGSWMLQGEFTWLTTNNWPTTLPGSPA